MLRSPTLPAIALAALLWLTGCGSMMAASGQPDPDREVLWPGTHRTQVEEQLGEPVATRTLDGGETHATYEYEIGDEAAPGRAQVHSMLDAWTFYLWEVVATPLEAFAGESHEVDVVYGPDDRVRRVVRWTEREENGREENERPPSGGP